MTARTELDVSQLVFEAHERCEAHLSPYNDPIVVGGQETYGYEIFEQLPDLDAAFFACGAGDWLPGLAVG